MQFKVGDQVMVESESPLRQPQRGVVTEVLRSEPHPRYSIRWEDGHESIYSPAAGALRPGPARARSRAGQPRPSA